jgi:hypothetical protein
MREAKAMQVDRHEWLDVGGRIGLARYGYAASEGSLRGVSDGIQFSGYGVRALLRLLSLVHARRVQRLWKRGQA